MSEDEGGGVIPAQAGEADRLAALDGMAEDQLRELVKRGQAILEEREKEKRRAAVREIERLAREHGIEVELKGERKRRGRPPKAKEAQAAG